MSLFGRQGGSVRKPGGSLGPLAPGTGSLVVTGRAPTAGSTAGGYEFSSLEFSSEFNIDTSKTASGAPIPAGWALQRFDTFGTSGSVPGTPRLHSLYYEAIWFGRDAISRVAIPNTVINNQQQTYQHFEDPTWLFLSDRLRIQGRGQGDGSIKSGQLCNKLTFRSFIIEARITSPSAAGSWAAFWNYSATSGNDSSELDVEIVISNPPGSGSNLGVHDVSLYNHPAATGLVISDSHFTSSAMDYNNASFDVSTGPHYYTIVYDDTGPGTLKKYIDGVLIYTGTFKWNASLGGTGFGPDAALILDLSVGGAFAGSLATPSAYSGDLDIYSISVYAPGSAGRAVPVGQAWNFNATNAHCTLSNNDLTVTTSTNAINQPCYALDSVTSGWAGAGKFYWEIVTSGATDTPGCGIGSYLDPVVDGNFPGQFNDNIGWYSAGGVFYNFAQVATWSTFGPGSVRLCIALDMVNLKIWGRAGTTGLWNAAAIGSQNPATNTGGLTLPSTIRFQVVPGVNLKNTGDTATLCATPSSWAGTPPAGFGPTGPT